MVPFKCYIYLSSQKWKSPLQNILTQFNNAKLKANKTLYECLDIEFSKKSNLQFDLPTTFWGSTNVCISILCYIIIIIIIIIIVPFIFNYNGSLLIHARKSCESAAQRYDQNLTSWSCAISKTRHYAASYTASTITMQQRIINFVHCK